jgi:hypothetical protein
MLFVDLEDDGFETLSVSEVCVVLSETYNRLERVRFSPVDSGPSPWAAAMRGVGRWACFFVSFCSRVLSSLTALRRRRAARETQ